MKYRLRHITRYHYATPVDLAAHVVHLRPRDFAHQRVIGTALMSLPLPVRETEAIDHFGNRVSRLFLDQPHTGLEVTAEAVVDVEYPLPPPAAETPPWEDVVAAARTGEAAEFTFASPMVPLLPEARDYVAQCFPPGRPVLEGLIELTGRIRHEFTFRAGVTSIWTPITQLFKRREGVCQDFSHLMIACLRARGLAARYVSGYIRQVPASPEALVGWGASHAWVAVFTPPFGWMELDPTNDMFVGTDHVSVAWGRDFGDVSPLRGIILGGGSHRLSVGVKVEAIQ